MAKFLDMPRETATYEGGDVTNEIRSPVFFFTWDIHYKCNYYCTYCFLHFEPETANIEAVYLSPERWIKIWEDIYKRHGPCQIAVTGGEPFTYPHFIDLISELQKLHTFEFSTNLSWDIDEFISKVRPERVIINSSYHPEYINLEDFTSKLWLLKKNNYQLSITVVAYPPFLNDILGYKAKFTSEGFSLNIFPYRGPYQGKKYPEGYTDLEKDLLKKLGMSVESERNKKLYETWVDKKEAQAQEPVCRMGQQYAKIIPDGEAYRCCAAVHKDWGCLGNIINGSFNLNLEPSACLQHSQNCVCFRAMLVGEEERWLKHWNAIASKA